MKSPFGAQGRAAESGDPGTRGSVEQPAIATLKERYPHHSAVETPSPRDLAKRTLGKVTPAQRNRRPIPMPPCSEESLRTRSQPERLQFAARANALAARAAAIRSQSGCNSQPERTPDLQLGDVCRTASRGFAFPAFASRGPEVGRDSSDCPVYRSFRVAIAGDSTDPRVPGSPHSAARPGPPKGDVVSPSSTPSCAHSHSTISALCSIHALNITPTPTTDPLVSATQSTRLTARSKHSGSRTLNTGNGMLAR